ncbi:hypothetical protein QVD17_08986 [Tagetes erecta]|uniref:Uncharacterized protein n=1 Tax=Tagetes erecta TaxID=13708 RepID=A0AAD8KYI4_TARER|nr:hypothetical protein QVD17_08986 [Tagetes erecta]
MFYSVSSFRIPSPSPRTDTLLSVARINLTPEGVKRNFLQLRELLNDYAREERLKGVRVRLDYENEQAVTPSLLCLHPSELVRLTSWKKEKLDYWASYVMSPYGYPWQPGYTLPYQTGQPTSVSVVISNKPSMEEIVVPYQTSQASKVLEIISNEPLIG